MCTSEFFTIPLIFHLNEYIYPHLFKAVQLTLMLHLYGVVMLMPAVLSRFPCVNIKLFGYIIHVVYRDLRLQANSVFRCVILAVRRQLSYQPKRH